MKVYSIALFRHEASGYESPACGESQGRFFSNFFPTMLPAFERAWANHGWTLRVHHDEKAWKLPCWSLLTQCPFVELQLMGEAKTLCGSMLWRLRPIFGTQADVVVCRDVDSLPMDRDRKMVEDFIESGAGVHAIHDSESHSGPLMGGMTAFRADAFFEAFPKVISWDKFEELASSTLPHMNVHGADQRFMNEVLWPKLQKNSFIHTRRATLVYPAKITRPVRPQETELDKVVRHIGAAYDLGRAHEVLWGKS